MRGNPVPRRRDRDMGRSIPAHAGQPDAGQNTFTLDEVYPRACGATRRFFVLPSSVYGLSPRMRGNHSRMQHYITKVGSIPAACGATGELRKIQHRIDGLSRACGATRPEPRVKQFHTVYPRACGATPRPARIALSGCGLSPRMRGNPGRRRGNAASTGSIPAHAGQPALSIGHTWATTVYPRACGATVSRPMRATTERGLSPRMRGNPGRRRGNAASTGSIPAHAGQPRCECCRPSRRWVYPRACGATYTEHRYRACGCGLSPRMRGNRIRRH